MDVEKITSCNSNNVEKNEEDNEIRDNARLLVFPSQMYIQTPYDSIRKAITQKKFIEMGKDIENID